MKLERTTLMGDSCWVCGTRFKNSAPPGKAMREDHHIFPRNAGGTDGPVVSLCADHHSVLHYVAKRIQTKKPFKDLLHGEPVLAQKRIVWLASMVVKAEASTADDPNKQFLNSVKLNSVEIKMMERLQAHYLKPRSDLFRAGLHLLYHKVFK